MGRRSWNSVIDFGGSCVIVGSGLEEGRWINKHSILFHWSGFPVTGSSCELGFVHMTHTGCDNSDSGNASGTHITVHCSEELILWVVKGDYHMQSPFSVSW